MKSKKMILYWGAVLLWMLLILSFSSDTAVVSDRKSSMVLEKVEPVIETVEKSIHVELIENSKLHFYVRKNAHMFNYCVLAVLISLALKASGVNGHRRYFLAYIMATLFSMLDEYYQTHIPGRSGEVRDVFVDNVGVLVGLMVIWIIKKKVTISKFRCKRKLQHTYQSTEKYSKINKNTIQAYQYQISQGW
ncbi:VanZ family protein [Peptoclostridium litorale]|uniref:VanZ family protein n=1 Tax=Peptoclostridium litorale TaxID=1557 RepID=UPI00135633EA|nr:VanZ family protein [Peptoclostridium litorale]